MSTHPVTWVEAAAGSAYDVDNLPYAVFSTEDTAPRIGVRIGDHVLDLGAAATALRPDLAPLLDAPALNPLMAAGATVWAEVRSWATELLTDTAHRDRVRLVPLADVTLHLPFEVGDYVDYYASVDHATNVGRIFRPDGDALMPNWRHLPVAYHGRAGSIVVSGTPVHRPAGQRKAPADPAPTFGPSLRLDIEAELGFVVGRTVPLGQRVATSEFTETVFGVTGVNDWSSRDIQAWEYVPLGPNLGKSFATSISAWVTPLAALEHARTELPSQEPAVLPYLREEGPSGYDIDVEVEVNGTVVARPPYASMYWSPAQMLAHLTVNGASLRVGDFYASGTISGPEKHQRGSFLELSWGGKETWTAGGEERTFLEDGDEVVLRYSAPGARGRIGLGEVRGRILPTIRPLPEEVE
ncbi:fumarylacetoacetase [Streptomyces drozdowiczii]|uniref:fumarylacetoacetase n=1 Tax=Streptomyces drozdowiczii TaxID=202862 RepID=A0ABY6PZW3_9ACTN|nr:fumarylacetoacetase [Streptomyces drozdowiczii]MCX0242514.1 fumarylacetoacetase [Streptomyces drozdowiczii]UZK57443.1 fumarylacetoacetase [Streptomyces drozdowiczii]